MPRPSLDASAQRLIDLACTVLDAPVGLLSLYGEDRTVFRTVHGLEIKDIRSDVSVTRMLIEHGPDGLIVIPDGRKDARVLNHPLVTGPVGLRFYAGATVCDRTGRPVGSIGVMDHKARPGLNAAQTALLRDLARMAGDLIDRQADDRVAAETAETLEMAESMAGVGHWRLDFVTGHVTWSDEVFRIHGLERGAVDPTDYTTIGRYHPEDLATLNRLVAHAKATGEGYDARLRIHRDDGERVTRARARCERDETGAVVALFGVFQDITDSARALEQQEELLSTLRMAEHVAGLGHWRLEVATGKVHWSDEVYRIHGVDPATFDPSYDDAVAFYHPDDRQAVSDWVAAALETGVCSEFRLRLIRADGEQRTVVSQCVPERGVDGRIAALFGVFQDVTEAERAVEKMRRSEARYRLLADNVGDVIARIQPGGRSNYISPAIHALLGHTAQQMAGMKAQDFVHPEDRAAVLDAIERGLAGKGSQRLQHRAVRRDGSTVWVESHLQAVPDGRGGVRELVVVIRDVSKRKALEEELVKARNTAEAGARAKSEFLANMSHELRTPLTAVIGFAGLLKAGDALGAQERRFVDRIGVASEALLSVINDILDVSKLDADGVELETRAFSPRDLAEGVTGIIEAQCQAKGLTLDCAVDDVVPQALIGDEGRLRQVLLNFLSNAMKFTEHGSVRLDLGVQDGRLRAAVSDTGVGIAPDKIERLFERFTQADASTSRTHGGTGLGLAISRRLIEMMGGEIGAFSQPGRGSTFWFEVPLAAAEALTATPRTFDDAVETRPLRILMADDAAANRELVTLMLGQAGGLTVDTVENGQEALTAVRAGHYDLVLMDVHMPVMDGLAATRAIRAETGSWAAVPIVALTANVDARQVEQTRHAGMDAHVGKPIQVAELLSCIRRLTTSTVPEQSRKAAG